MADDPKPAEPADSGLKIELAFVPLDNLIVELRKRCPTMLFVGHGVRSELHLYWGGNGTDAIGLAEYAKVRIIQLITIASCGEMRAGDEPGTPSKDG